MNGKPIGLKMKHFGQKWLKVDDQFSQISREPSQAVYEEDEEMFESFPNTRVFDSLNNVTFDIPEEPEYTCKAPGKLVIDEYPGNIVHRKVRSQVSKSVEYHPLKSKSPAPKRGFGLIKEEDSLRFRNLYYYLHQPVKGKSYEKYLALQNCIKGSDAVPKFISYLQKKNYRIPSYLQNEYGKSYK